MGKTSKSRRRTDKPYAVEGHHVPQPTFIGQSLVESSPQGNLAAPLSSSPPPSSVGSVLSIPDESPVTPQTFSNTMNVSHFSSSSESAHLGEGLQVSLHAGSAATALASTNNSTTAASSLSPGVSGGVKSTFTAWFITEVMAMMHGLGDVKKPLPESAAIVEELVHQQMVSFVLQALEVSQLRNPYSSSRLEPEDCLFLMRKNKVKLKRLYKYVLVRELKEKANSSSFDAEEHSKDAESQAAKGKLKGVIRNFAQSIDDSAHSLLTYLDDGNDDVLFNYNDDDDEEIVDSVKMERLRRAEIQSRRMSVQQYMDFAEARGVSFGKKAKTKNKLKEWLFQGSRHLHRMDVKVDVGALDIICYLAKETVAEIVDMAILVHQESLVRIEDPRTHVRGIPPPPRPIEGSTLSSASSSNTWDAMNIPGLGGNDEKPLGESRSALQPWHIREGISRYMDNGFGPFSLRRKNLDPSRMGRVLLCV